MKDFEKPYKKVSRIRALLLFLLWPTKFSDYAAEHDTALVLSKTPNLRTQQLAGKQVINIDEYRSNATERAEVLRRSLLHAALIVLFSAIIGLMMGIFLNSLFGSLKPFTNNLLQAIAVGIILWATLWQLTRDIRTIGGETLPERIHGWIFSALYTVGTFILFVDYGWQILLK